MGEKINLTKIVYNKEYYPKIIDTKFYQLINSDEYTTPIELNVDDFFELYNKLFFEIPIDGDINSHKELIKRSTEYVGETQNTEEIDLLLEEINQLRLELLESRQTIDDLTQ